MESQRSLLISCVLIALENKAFKTAYPLFGSTNEKDTADEKGKKVEIQFNDVETHKINKRDFQEYWMT